MSRWDELITDLADIAEEQNIIPPGRVSKLDVRIKVMNIETRRYAWVAVNMPNNDGRFREIVRLRDDLATELLERHDDQK